MAASPDPMEQEDHSSEISTDSGPVRYFPLRMGSNVQRGEHWRLMVPTRIITAHQLPRIVGSRSGFEVISERAAQGSSLAATRQLHSYGIRQQSGGDNLPSAHSLGKNTVALGLGEGHHNYSPTHSRCVQHCSRL